MRVPSSSPRVAASASTSEATRHGFSMTPAKPAERSDARNGAGTSALVASAVAAFDAAAGSARSAFSTSTAPARGIRQSSSSASKRWLRAIANASMPSWASATM